MVKGWTPVTKRYKPYLQWFIVSIIAPGLIELVVCVQITFPQAYTRLNPLINASCTRLLGGELRSKTC